MNIKKITTTCLAVLLCLLTLTACLKTETAQMANELQFSLDKITSITISYDEENIFFYESENNNLIIKEYLSENKRDYYAKVDENGNSIKISEGAKPLFSNDFIRYIEVYLPSNYSHNLTVTSTSGEVDLSNINLNLSMLLINDTSGTVTLVKIKASEVHISSTSGILKLGDIQGNKIHLETTSGSITCDKLKGNVTYTSTSGDLDVKSAIGSGSYHTSNSGKLNIVYNEVSSDLSLYNKNHNITLSLPQDLQFSFKATTKNGSVTTNFQQSLTVNGATTSGTIGDNPSVTITAETKDGDIEVTQ